MAACKYCGMEIEGEPNFCGNCGVLLGSMEVEDPDVLTEGLEDDWEVGGIQDVEDVARIAVPENYKEFSLEHLRRRVVQAIWMRSTGIDPYATFGVSGIDPEQHRQIEIAKESGWGRAVWMGSDAQSDSPVQRYHLLWSCGLISHVRLTSEEAQRVGSIMAMVGYQTEPCDCNEVAYIQDSHNPGYVRRA